MATENIPWVTNVRLFEKKIKGERKQWTRCVESQSEKTKKEGLGHDVYINGDSKKEKETITKRDQRQGKEKERQGKEQGGQGTGEGASTASGIQPCYLIRGRDAVETDEKNTQKKKEET